MISYILKKILGTQNEREVKKITPIIEEINSLEEKISKLSNEELKEKTLHLKDLLNQEEKDDILDEILPETFALVREASKRTTGLRHYDVQLIGGIVLHRGKIAEMKTGEGKTLVATLPIYLNALEGKGVHLVTVNDYLAKRDTQWMGPIYNLLGLTIGCIQHEVSYLYDEEYSTPDAVWTKLRPCSRREAYLADITYGTNNEFGFDYLRDNMVVRAEDMVQRGHHYAIVDEVDSILIDEARTPLIISGPSEESTDKYYKINRIIPKLKKEEDYQLDEKTRTATLTEQGVSKVESLLSVENLFDNTQIETVHHVNQALKAHALFKIDVDYVVKDGEVIIVDEFTGRLMPGRRYSDGLHQALEAKENVKIANENQTLATITFQNYFRMYKKLAGMTGTAETEAEEFYTIYKLDVNVIPTNMPMVRIDHPDVVYKTEKEKFNAVIDEIAKKNEQGQPILVGTISIEKSEILSSMLSKRGVKHTVLNAKYHEKEAEIIKNAGQKASVTIATNMAGRGVDIILGEGVKELGGLHILGTERHESRRIDNQLRGRSGRQGDSGSSRFYMALEDDLMRIFGSDRIAGIMDRFGMAEGQQIEHGLVSRAIESAQKKVEGHNFDIRKHLLEYDNVMNVQREVIYTMRKMIFEGHDLKEKILEMIEDVLDSQIDIRCPEKTYPEEWEWATLKEWTLNTFGLNVDTESVNFTKVKREELKELLIDGIQKIYDEKENSIGTENMRHIERVVLLQTIDAKWKDHLLAMDYLKEGIGLRAYGQKDPLIEYKTEGYNMFSDMIENIKEEITSFIFKVQVTGEVPQLKKRRLSYSGSGEDGEAKKQPTVKREGKKVGRNDPCPCGSGKKYKKCCGK